MKKILFTVLMALSFFVADAIPLFPYFVDVAGDYNDGTPIELESIGLPCINYRRTPSFYSNIKEADDFLNDVMPVTNENIVRTVSHRDGFNIVTYSSSISDEYNSVIYLVETPLKEFIIGYGESETSGR